jgi:hypothetical protein
MTRLLDFQIAATAYSAATLKEAQGLGSKTVDEWSLLDIVGHLAMVNVMCTRSSQGLGPETLPALDVIIGDDADAAFASTTSLFVATFAALGDVDLVCPTPVGPYPAWVVQTQGSLEHLIHACDVAAAFELAPPSDELVADAATRILAQPALYDTFRAMGMYKTSLAVDPDASAFARLRACLGRTV